MDNLRAILSNPRNFVSSWLDIKGIKINQRGDLVEPKLERDTTDILGSMWLDYSEQIMQFNAAERLKASNLRVLIGKFTQKDLETALEEHLSLAKAEARKEAKAAIVCEQEDLTPIRRFVKAVKGYETEEDVAVVAHWIWMVKRKMNNLPVKYHIMPVFYGKQGGGKTIALTNLISPIEDYRLNIKMNQMTDDRYFKAMSENYVVVFDELQGASRTDIDALKNQITTDYNDARRLGTHRVPKIRQSCSFIGATNKPVKEQIIDYTGMRRFWELACQDKLDWEEINSIDYLALYKGVDERKELGYTYDKLHLIEKTQQEELEHKDEVAMFLEETGINFSVDGSGTFKSTKELFTMYREWRAQNCMVPQDFSRFYTKLPRFAQAKPVTKKVGKTTQKGYYINFTDEVDRVANSNVVVLKGLGIIND